MKTLSIKVWETDSFQTLNRIIDKQGACAINVILIKDDICSSVPKNAVYDLLAKILLRKDLWILVLDYKAVSAAEEFALGFDFCFTTIECNKGKYINKHISRFELEKEILEFVERLFENKKDSTVDEILLLFKKYRRNMVAGGEKRNSAINDDEEEAVAFNRLVCKTEERNKDESRLEALTDSQQSDGYNGIEYEEIEGIAYLSLCAPPANIMTPIFFIEITKIINEHVLNTKMQGVLIFGKGRNFSSGANVEQIISSIKLDSSNFEDDVHRKDKWYMKCREAFMRLSQLSKPVVSVISGFCIGSGFELALASNMRVCEKNAKIGLVESGFNLLPGLRGTIRMSEIVGHQKALEIILKGDILDAEEALALGLADVIVSRKMGLEYAREFILNKVIR